jgi:hypothetical protein
MVSKRITVFPVCTGLKLNAQSKSNKFSELRIKHLKSKPLGRGLEK